MSDFNPDDFNIVQNVNFDPMAILHGDQEMTKEPLFTKKTEEDKKAAPAEPVEKKAPIDITDEMLEEGFKKASGEASKNAGGPTGKQNQDLGSLSIKKADSGNEDDESPKNVKGTDDLKNAFAIHYKLMVDAGEWDEIEDFDGTEEKYQEAKTFNATNQANAIADGYFNEAFKANPDGRDMGLKLFHHLRQGGKVKDFVDLHASEEFSFDDLDSSDDNVAESAAKELIYDYYSSIGWKKEKISAKINNLEKTGQLVNEAKDVQEPYQDLTKQQQNLHQQNLEREQNQQKINRKKNTDAIKKMIDDNINFGPLKLYNSQKEKKELDEYIFSPDEETGKTAFASDLDAGLKDPKFLLFAAVAYRNKLHENADALKTTDKDATTKAVSSLRQTLEGAMLNKGISNSKESNSEIKTKTSGYQFDLDNALVIQ